MIAIRVGQGSVELAGPPGVRLEMVWFVMDEWGDYGWFLVLSGATRPKPASRTSTAF